MPRRLPPPHLGHAYRNVFVETAALEVVIVLPASGGDGAEEVAASGSAAPADARGSAGRARGTAPRVPLVSAQTVVPAPQRQVVTDAGAVAPPPSRPGATARPGGGPSAPLGEDAPGERPVRLSRTALVVL